MLKRISTRDSDTMTLSITVRTSCWRRLKSIVASPSAIWLAKASMRCWSSALLVRWRSACLVICSSSVMRSVTGLRRASRSRSEITPAWQASMSRACWERRSVSWRVASAVSVLAAGVAQERRMSSGLSRWRTTSFQTSSSSSSARAEGCEQRSFSARRCIGSAVVQR